MARAVMARAARQRAAGRRRRAARPERRRPDSWALMRGAGRRYSRPANDRMERAMSLSAVPDDGDHALVSLVCAGFPLGLDYVL
jgi:hypothetical protein